MTENNEELIPIDVPQQKQVQKAISRSPVDEPIDPNYDVSKRPNNVLNVIEKWDELFNVYSFNNTEYSKSCLHLVIGQLIRNCRVNRIGTKIDPRISVLYLKPTFTGGSAGYDMVANVSEKLGLRVETVADVTDAALIGSVDENGDEIKGVMDKSVSDILYWGEPSMIFKNNLPSSQIKVRNYIQMGLNPIDSKESSLKRRLKKGNSLCESECGLLLVTFNPEELNDSVLKSGFIHRFCAISKTVSLQDRAFNASIDISRLRVDANSIDIEAMTDEIVSILKHVIEFGKTNKRFTVTYDASTTFQSMMISAFSKIKKLDTPERTKEHLSSIQSSIIRKVTQFAMHHSALRFSTNIEKEDFEYAFKVIEEQLETMKQYLEDSVEHKKAISTEHFEEDSIMHNVMQYASDNNLTKPEIPKKAMLEIISATFKINSSKSIYAKYNHLISSGEIQETVDGKFVILSNVKSNP